MRKNAIIATDIHDRVNYAVVNRLAEIDKEQKLCLFNITIDTDICPVMEYFEIFLDRMVLCRKARRSFGAHVRAYHQRHASAVIRITPIIPRIGAAVHTLSNCGSFVLSFVHFFAV